MGTVGVGTVQPAYAETNDIYAEANEAQKVVEQTAAAYDEAVKRVEDLQNQINENSGRIKELEKAIPDQENRSNNAIRELYMLQREGASLIDLILASDSFSDLLDRMDYVGYIHDQHLGTLENLQSMKQELEQTRTNLNVANEEAKAERQKAEEALKAAQEAREKAQQEAQRRAAAEAAAREAQAAAAAGNLASNVESSRNLAASRAELANGNGAAAGANGGSGITQSPTNDNADWSQDKATFVNEWAPRIDAYLKGSPLSGYGKTFAQAAWDYGVDPRWSPAISCIESSKGAVCFLPHNAWGWGSSSWGSWDEAIPAHVCGLARGYGYTLSEAAAQKYCPPTWQDWYTNVSAEMNKI